MQFNKAQLRLLMTALYIAIDTEEAANQAHESPIYGTLPGFAEGVKKRKKLIAKLQKLRGEIRDHINER